MNYPEGLQGPGEMFHRHFPGQPRFYRAPGRINIIGEHTDYNGGLVMPATIDLHTVAAVAPGQAGHLRVFLSSEQRTHIVDFNQLAPRGDGHSLEYLKGVAWALMQRGIRPRGYDIAVNGNLPIGGGLSSSASLELLLAFSLLDHMGIDLPAGELAALCRQAEQEFVGVSCGIMDQFIIELGQAGQAMVLDCRSQEYEWSPVPEDAAFLVVHSGEQRALQSGDYNQRREECDRALKLLKSHHPELEYLSEAGEEALGVLEASGEETAWKRARHVLGENRRVREAQAAMTAGDTGRLGELMNQSHDSLRDDFEVSCQALEDLVGAARNTPGVLGARLMGAGFGGCAIVLVERAQAQQAAADIRRDYGAVLGSEPWMHLAGPAGPVERIDS